MSCCYGNINISYPNLQKYACIPFQKMPMALMGKKVLQAIKFSNNEQAIMQEHGTLKVLIIFFILHSCIFLAISLDK